MLIIGNDIVADILKMPDVLRVQEEAFRKLPTGGAMSPESVPAATAPW